MASRPIEPFEPFADLLMGAEKRRVFTAEPAVAKDTKAVGIVAEALGFNPALPVPVAPQSVDDNTALNSTHLNAKVQLPAATKETIKSVTPTLQPSAKAALRSSTHLHSVPNITLPAQPYFIESYNHAPLAVKQPVKSIPVLEKLKTGAASGLETPEWWVPSTSVSGKSALNASTVLRDAPARIAVPAYTVIGHDAVGRIVEEIAQQNSLNPQRYADLTMEIAQHEVLSKLPVEQLREVVSDAFTSRKSLAANGLAAQTLEGGATLLDGAQAFKRSGGEVGVEHVLKAHTDRTTARNFVPILDEGRMAELRARVNSSSPSNVVQKVKQASKLTTLEKVNGAMAGAAALLLLFGGASSLKQAFQNNANQTPAAVANDNTQPSIHAPSLAMAALQFTLALGAGYGAHHAFTSAR